MRAAWRRKCRRLHLPARTWTRSAPTAPRLGTTSTEIRPPRRGYRSIAARRPPRPPRVPPAARPRHSLPMTDLLDRVAALSPEKRALLEKLRAGPVRSQDTIPRISDGPAPLSAEQRRLWYL